MELSHEDIVTMLLSKREIIGIDGEFYDEDNNRINPLFNSAPRYDLTFYLKNAPKEPSRGGDKYMFVK